VIILTGIKLHTILMPIQAFQTSSMKKGCIIISAENFEQDMALQDSVFPLNCRGLVTFLSLASQILVVMTRAYISQKEEECTATWQSHCQ
jgi:hypothetical protein